MPEKAYYVRGPLSHPTALNALSTHGVAMLHLVAGLGYDWACMSLIRRGADSNLPVSPNACCTAVKHAWGGGDGLGYLHSVLQIIQLKPCSLGPVLRAPFSILESLKLCLILTS